MSVTGKSGGESETAASTIFSVHENVQRSSQMMQTSIFQKTLSCQYLDSFIQEISHSAFPPTNKHVLTCGLLLASLLLIIVKLE